MRIPNERHFENWDLMASAIAARAAGFSRESLKPEARHYYYMRLAPDLARATLVHTGLDLGKPDGQMADLAMTVGELPFVIGNVFGKLLLGAYDAASPLYRLIAARRDFPNLMATHFVRMGDAPSPSLVGEHGEFKSVPISDTEEVGYPATYGEIIPFTRQAIINDDLSALNAKAMDYAGAMADFENANFFSKLITAASFLGPTMRDAHPVYDSAHSNVVGAGALDLTRLGAARALIKKQQSLSGRNLNTESAYLLVSPDSQSLAEQLVAGLALGEGNTRLQVKADAAITGTRFFVLGDPALGRSNYLWGRLEGQTGPEIEPRAGWGVDGVEFKIRMDLIFCAVDWRFGATGAGA